eukprot:CAMPEP_0179469390 /NCGR_PEP_ID=MMETSP0799-20121207/50088_1 /TAXON_ID=46947 /ORGANISM="Geminigera cryophila, Strain CCMP2564" /LENGTH=121 /DNA_ID=CAMNT_0021275889 /DNA_START=415 /DNA_END=780 /DNA_ORIENTATION=-
MSESRHLASTFLPNDSRWISVGSLSPILITACFNSGFNVPHASIACMSKGAASSSRACSPLPVSCACVRCDGILACPNLRTQPAACQILHRTAAKTVPEKPVARCLAGNPPLVACFRAGWK